MARGPQWLGLTLPLAAFLGSAAGVVVTERLAEQRRESRTLAERIEALDAQVR